MSLKSQFKVDTNAVNDGVWFDVCVNSDGSKCRVKLRRHGRGNALWSIAYRAATRDVDTDAVTPQEDEVITAKIFCEGNVAGWENMQPDDDGKELKFNLDNAKKLLTDPDWVDLLKDWQGKASSLAPFQVARESEAKN